MTEITETAAPLQPSVKNKMAFTGSGTELLGIMLLNWVLTAITLGLYYPWARIARLKFIYQNTDLNGTPFIFHGTGKEVFKGFIKFFAFLAVMYSLIFVTAAKGNKMLADIIVYILFLSFIVIIPLAIHGALRYRLSRTSWRGIHFGYRGERGKLIMDFITGYFATIFTLGLYSAWFVNNLRTYIIGNCRFGSLYFGYDGKGSELFWINLKGFFLSIITLGIYYFWYMKNWMNYYADHTYIEQNGQRHYLRGKFEGGDYFALVIINLFLTLFTFGLGTPWVIVRTAKYVLSNLDIPEGIDFENIAQTEDDYGDATGDDIIDYLDLGII